MAVHRLWVVFICLSDLFLSIGKYFLKLMLLLLLSNHSGFASNYRNNELFSINVRVKN